MRPFAASTFTAIDRSASASRFVIASRNRARTPARCTGAAAEPPPPGGGERDERRASVVGVGDPSNEAVALQAVDRPGRAARGQQHARSEIGQVQSRARGPVEVQEHLVIGKRQPRSLAQLGVQRSGRRVMGLQEREPRLELRVRCHASSLRAR